MTATSRASAPEIFVRECSVPPTGEGPLSGLTLAVKDNIDQAGEVSGSGTPAWAATHAPASQDAPALSVLRQAGATLTGRTIMDELAFSLMGRNLHFGTPPNGAAPDRMPGGSSSGSAAAVSCGKADIALGTDTGGSVRLPAAWCGIHGIRPSHGAVPISGVTPLAPSFDVVGWFARSAELMRIVGALYGLLPRREFSRVWMPTELWQGADPVLSAIAATLALTLDVHEGPVPESGPARSEAFRIVQAFEAWETLGAFVAEHGADMAPDVRGRFEAGRDADPRELAAALRAREVFAGAMEAALEGDTLMIFPTSPGPAPLRNAPQADLDAARGAAIGALSIAGLARLPQYAFPLPRADGPPLSLSMVAAPGRDGDLLNQACVLETLCQTP